MVTKNEKATMRDFLTYVLGLEIDKDARAFAEAEIEKLNARNEKRKSKPSAKSLANVGLKEQILELLAGGGMVASVIAETLSNNGEEAVSTQKASALCHQLVDEGKVTATEVKVKGKGKVKQYTLVKDADEDEDETEATE